MSTYTPIATQTLGSAAASVTFSSIPQGYTDLILVITGNNNQGTAYISWLNFNNDTSTNYSYTRIVGDGTAAASTRDTSSNYGYGGWTNNQTSQMILGMNHIQNYSNSTTYKTWLTRGGDTTERVYASVGLWRKTEAITSIKIQVEAGTYDAGSTFSLYGIAGGQITTKASGGIVTTSGAYSYHTFITSGRFTPLEDLTADILVIAGGGGAGGIFSQGYRNSGGGGAGGLLNFTSQSLTKDTGYGVTVGAGGAAGYSYSIQALSGNNSQFGTLTTVIGGGFGVNQYVFGEIPGGNGGSGGGGAYTAGGTATSSQGNNGGTSSSDGGGGGGGAGAVGANGSGNNGGNGGIGLSTYSTYASATSTGDSGYYAGGGGGGFYTSGTGGTGGTGGGGAAGGASVSGNSGLANTGGGGGASGYGTSNLSGGAGGSGLVIVRYLT